MGVEDGCGSDNKNGIKYYRKHRYLITLFSLDQGTLQREDDRRRLYKIVPHGKGRLYNQSQNERQQVSEAGAGSDGAGELALK